MGEPRIRQEQAIVWTGGGRRFFTRKAAVRAEAKSIVRADLQGQGSDGIPIEDWLAAVNQVVAKIETGEVPDEVDWDALTTTEPSA